MLVGLNSLLAKVITVGSTDRNREQIGVRLTMRLIIWILVAALIVVHQDFWYWDDPSLVFGFIPIGLFYHLCLSVAASFVWLLACTFAWPKGIDEFEDESNADVQTSTDGEGGGQ